MTTILKPGILVSLKTTLAGGVSYQRVDLEPEHTNGGGESIARWETTRVIDDPDEYARAVKVRGQVTSAVRGRCAQSAFGLLCPESGEADLDAALAEARSLCDAWNREAKTVQVHAYALKGRVASTDEEATRAIASEIEGLLADMERGIRGGDAKSIREAASRAREIGAVLDDSQAAKVTMAVEAARKAAREIVKRVEKGGEDAQQVIAELASSSAAVELARFAFLDLAEPARETLDAPDGDAMPAVSAQRFAEIEV